MKKTNESNFGRTPFGQRLLQARQAKGLTQKQVEARVGITQSNLASLEREGTGSSFTVALAILYGVNPIWLALGTGPTTGAQPIPDWLARLAPNQQTSIQRFAESLLVLSKDEQTYALAIVESIPAILDAQRNISGAQG
ncbi:XRE family transcriptional regulator [Cupriavidus basilensis OR16]|uniref:XRE family transcriptional regulator n=1 Tax=Cupriavidus basilensis OR16 TaxID=1127483 RepID=H1RZT9_9BURK|nr:helix-turn-helix transcriptional regulator [Cupriavidus basilensis]EHP44155.1 XRE family transcriptional regulator [Cupriavidus basilensis OR16]